MSDTPTFLTHAPIRGFSDIMAVGGAFDSTWKLARLMANSGLVPKHFENNPEACFVALVQAIELDENPIVLMQNMFVVYGMPGFSAKYMIARANKSGIFKGRINWRIEDRGARKAVRKIKTGWDKQANRAIFRDEQVDARDLSVTAWAVLADTGEEIHFTVDLGMAEAENWLSNDKYLSMPELMYRYRSASILLRLYAPETMLSSYSNEELETLGGEVISHSVVSRPVPAAIASGRQALGLSDNGDLPDPLVGIDPREDKREPIEVVTQTEPAQQPVQASVTPSKMEQLLISIEELEAALLDRHGPDAVASVRREAKVDGLVLTDCSEQQLRAYRLALRT